MSVAERFLHRNPELLKSVWLEISLPRLIVMPVLLFLVRAAAFAIPGEVPGQYYHAIMCYEIFTCAVLFIYGSWLAANSYLREVNESTWNFQRMSSIEPWRMTVGKLVGGPLYAWYGGLLGVAALLWTLTEAPPETWEFLRDRSPYCDVLLILAACVMAHALALLGAMQIAERNGGRSRSTAFFGIALGGFIWFAVAGSLTNKLQFWWGAEYPKIVLQTWSAAVFAMLAVLSVHSRMKRELQQGSAPWVYAIFLVVLWAYTTGLFMTSSEGIGEAMAPGICVLGALAVFMVAVDNNDLGKWRYLQTCVNNGQWRRALRQIPAWPVGFLVFSVFALYGVFAGASGKSASHLSYAKLWLFAVRDIVVVLWIMIAFKRRHADLMIIFAGAILYLFFPLIVGAGSWSGTGIGFALPVTPENSTDVPSLLFAIVQAAGAVALFVLFLRKRRPASA